MSKLNEDALQIVEQILPYFQPHFNLTVDLVSSIGEKRDIPMILERITMDDQYEGDFTTRRILIYTLDFTAKTYIYPKICGGPGGIILRSDIDFYNGVTGQVYYGDVGYTGDVETGSITQVTGDWSRP